MFDRDTLQLDIVSILDITFSMRLKEWREQHRISYARCAKRVGVANGTVVWRWEARGVIPQPELMLRIYVESGGLVTPNDFYDLPLLDGAAAA